MATTPSVTYVAGPVVYPYPSLFVSANIQAVTGYEAHEFLADPSFWLNRVHPEDVETMIAGVSNMFTKGEYEYRFSTATGGTGGCTTRCVAFAIPRASSRKSSVQIRYAGQHLGPIFLSFGVAIFPDHGRSGSNVLTAADAALYRAKKAGRNRVETAIFNEGTIIDPLTEGAP